MILQVAKHFCPDAVPEIEKRSDSLNDSLDRESLASVP
jgi:hypothetical protein